MTTGKGASVEDAQSSEGTYSVFGWR